MNDPESLLKAAQSIQGSDPQAAIFLRDKGTELQTARNTAADKQQQLASLARVVQEKTGLSPEESLALAADPATVRELVKPNTKITTANGRVLMVDGKGNTIKDLGVAQDTRPVTYNVLKTPTDTVGLVKSYEDLTKPQREMLNTAQTAKTLINQAASSNNSQAWEAARTQLAKAIGEGKLSNEDIKRTGNDPRIVQSVLDWVNKKVEGVPTQDIMKQLYTVASILEQISTDRINKSSDRVRTSARLAGVPDANMDELFPKMTTGDTVNWGDLKK
jgi:hypothetical protein